MTATGYLRGHPIYWDGGQYRYQDNDAPTNENWKYRPCGVCGERETKDGHDYCLRGLPGVMNACCGHGNRNEAYIQFENGVVVRGLIIDEGPFTNAPRKNPPNR